ncbi:helix-turn-helix domain-containing protein, partial [Bacteroides uniformis]
VVHVSNATRVPFQVLATRTLQEYRNEGRISYIQLGGKIIYKESDIERLLKDGYREAYLTDL